jgi:hypothetical protein
VGFLGQYSNFYSNGNNFTDCRQYGIDRGKARIPFSPLLRNARDSELPMRSVARLKDCAAVLALLLPAIARAQANEYSTIVAQAEANLRAGDAARTFSSTRKTGRTGWRGRLSMGSLCEEPGAASRSKQRRRSRGHGIWFTE